MSFLQKFYFYVFFCAVIFFSGVVYVFYNVTHYLKVFVLSIPLGFLFCLGFYLSLYCVKLFLTTIFPEDTSGLVSFLKNEKSIEVIFLIFAIFAVLVLIGDISRLSSKDQIILNQKLLRSIDRSDITATKNLLEKGADFYSIENSRHEALEISITLGNFELFKLLHRHETTFENLYNYIIYPPIFHVGNNYPHNLEYWNTLMYAALYGRVKIVEYLLREGTNPSIKYVEPGSGRHQRFPLDAGIALELAVQSGNIQTIDILLRETPIQALFGIHSRYCYNKVKYGQLVVPVKQICVRYLHGYLLDVIRYPRYKNHLGHVRSLALESNIKKGIEYNKNEIISMLFEAMKRNYGIKKAKEIILKNSLRVFVSGDKDLTLYWLSAFPWILDELDKTKFLNDMLGMVVRAEDDYRKGYFHRDSEYNYRKIPFILSYISKYGFDPEFISPYNKVVILSYITEKYLPLAKSFLKHGLNINHAAVSESYKLWGDSILRSKNALQIAVENGNLESVKILLDLGADPYQKDILVSNSFILKKTVQSLQLGPFSFRCIW